MLDSWDTTVIYKAIKSIELFFIKEEFFYIQSKGNYVYTIQWELNV